MGDYVNPFDVLQRNSKYTSTDKSTRDLLNALRMYAPEALKAISGTTQGVANDQLAVDRSLVGPYNELYNQGQLGSSATEAAVVGGPSGQSLVSSADRYQKQLDPEFYKQRGQISSAIDKYLGSYDPTKLTGSEEAQIARGIGATGGNLTQSNLNTIRNAQTFGNAQTQRWKNFGEAVSNASNAAQGLKSGISGFNVASQRGANPLVAGQNASDKAFGFANTVLGNTTQLANTSLGKEKTLSDQINATMGSY